MVASAALIFPIVLQLAPRVGFASAAGNIGLWDACWSKVGRGAGNESSPSLSQKFCRRRHRVLLCQLQGSLLCDADGYLRADDQARIREHACTPWGEKHVRVASLPEHLH